MKDDQQILDVTGLATKEVTKEGNKDGSKQVTKNIPKMETNGYSNGKMFNGIDHNKPTKVEQAKTIPQVLAMMTAAMAMVSAGTQFTWASPSIPKLLEPPYNFNIEQLSYLTILSPITMVIASPPYCWLLDNLGRKYTLLSCSVLHVTSWLLIYFADSIWMLYASRLVNGICDACVFATMPAYIAEVATPRVRGLYGNAMMVLMFIGQFLINCLGFYTSIKTTALVMLAIPVLFFAGFVFMPETPYFCVIKGRREAARESLRRLRWMENVDDELEQISKDVARQMSEESSYKDLWVIKSNRKAVVIANIARVIQQFSGISALMVYAQYIFMQAGGEISGGHASMIFSGVLAVVNVFSNVISDRLGRVKSMVISCFGSGLALASETIYFYLDLYTDIDVSVVGWFPVVGLVVYIVIFALGLGIVPTLFLGELFNINMRGKAALVTNIVFAVQLMVLTKFFQYLMTGFGLCVPFLFFTVCCFVGSVVSYFIMPETKGKTLEQIQQMLK